MSVTPFYGDPDLYLNFGQPSNIGNNDFAYRSSATGMTDTITVNPAGAGCLKTTPAACYCTDCDLYITVHGFIASSYSVSVVTESGTTELQDGVPAQGHSDRGEYKYFKLNINQPATEVDVQVTPVSGDPDLFVSFDYEHPNADQVASGKTRASRHIGTPLSKLLWLSLTPVLQETITLCGTIHHSKPCTLVCWDSQIARTPWLHTL